MKIFQKLSWLAQMGIRQLCDETPHPLESKQTSLGKTEISVEKLEKRYLTSKSGLSATATHPIGGVGVVPAKIICVLESPSANEDRTGIPLSGPEGELLKKMLKSIGLDIAVQTHVAYMSPWRAPGARVLTNTEIKEGMGLLNERLKLVQPQIILAFGMVVIRAMTGMTLGQVRSKASSYQGIPVYATFPPSFLIKNPDYKKQAWNDLKKIQSVLRDS